MALIGAGLGVVLLAATWYLWHYVGFLRRADVSILSGFVQLGRPGLDRVTKFLVSLCDPHQYLLLALIPVVVALLRRRPRLAVMTVAVLLCANETTQLLKPLLAAPRDPVPWADITTTASWPSGHATASMSLALMIVIAAPPRGRPLVAAAAAAFAIAVCYSFLELGWHYPSDVLGGYLVAATWTLLGMAALTLYEARRAARGAAVTRQRPRRGNVSVGETLAPMLALVVLAAVAFALIVLLRPHEVVAYARDHTGFVAGASAIGALALMLASGLTLMLRRPS